LAWPRGIGPGKLGGHVILLQQLLNQSVFSEHELAACSTEQLSEVVTDLLRKCPGWFFSFQG
jgi:hypothetical protein